jgi:hypothetical protein
LKSIAEVMKSFGKVDPLDTVKFSWLVGTCDLLFDDAIVDLNFNRPASIERRLKVLALNACLQRPRNNVYIYDSTKGKVLKIMSYEHHTLWRYIIDSYCTIQNHVNIVATRKNKRIAKGVKLPVIDKNLYVADTEFELGGKVFDYAMVNLEDPFSSIIQPLMTSSKFAVQWIAKHHNFWTPDELSVLFSKAKADLGECFHKLADKSSSVVIYYKAKEDVSQSTHYGMQSYDLCPLLSKVAIHHGASSEPVVAVKLGEIYDILVGPLQFQLHLHQHSALTDALILYELYHLGFLC